jgi:amidohydrolase
MRSIASLIISCILGLASTANSQPGLDALIDKQMPALIANYRMLHASPELSHYEEKTSAFVAKELRTMGFEVTERFGKYDNPQWTCYGVVAVLKNGAGPTVYVRTDMDALPVEEKTGLPYASTVKMKNDAGETVSAMHACGHDIHMSSFLGTARMLSQMKDRWRGTLVCIGQPAEETVHGAAAMLNDGLYTKFPKPDFVIALHDASEIEAGKVGYCPEYTFASSTTVDVTIRGLGGHGARPETTKDPIVVAAEFVLAVQTIVSRETSPLDPCVVSVGSIHGGTKSNIIPDEVKLQMTVRAYREEVRQHILASIERIAKHTALAAGVPPERAPIVSIGEGTVATYNDPSLSAKMGSALEKGLGAGNVLKLQPYMVSEDFSRYSLEGHQIPTFMFHLGAVDPASMAASKKNGTNLPSLHSGLFQPLPEPTIRTGIKSMTLAVLELLKK